MGRIEPDHFYPDELDIDTLDSSIMIEPSYTTERGVALMMAVDDGFAETTTEFDPAEIKELRNFFNAWLDWVERMGFE